MGRRVRAVRNAIAFLFLGLAYVVVAIGWLAGIALHLYTILLAYSISGLPAAALSLVFPILSQLYWIYKTWALSGNLINGYSFYVLCFLVRQTSDISGRWMPKPSVAEADILGFVGFL
jgi:hypothetical protein